MRKLLLAAMMALAFTSCTTVKAVTGFTVDQKTVAVAVTSSVAVEKLIPGVLKLPICSEGQKVIVDGCITAKLGDQVITDLRAMQAARNSLWAAAKADPNGVGAYDAYQAFKVTVAALQTDVGAKS